MIRLEQWLESRSPRPPESLRREMDALLATATPGDDVPLWDRLADAALAGLRDAAAEAGDRSKAGRLLAVDALLTYACEAAAEAGPERLRALTDRLDWARFEAIAVEVEE